MKRHLIKLKSNIFKFIIIVLVLSAISSTTVFATTYDNGKMWYSTSADYTFNVKGYHNGSLLKTTYADRGYSTYLKVNCNEYSLGNFSSNGATQTRDGIQIRLNLSTVSNGNYVKIEYEVKNTASYNNDISIATNADIMIGSNDHAPIENLSGNRGFKMSGDGAQFMFIGRDSYGVTNVDTYWFGTYNLRNSNKYNQSYTYQGSYTDSGMAWSWKNRNIAPGETQKYSALIGIGVLNNPPTINITSSVKDTYYRGEIVNIRGTVNDVDYSDVLTVKYAVDDGVEYSIGQKFVPNGSSKSFDLDFSIPTNLSVGNHQLKIWAADDKGNMSSPKVVNFNVSPFAPPTVPTYKNITKDSFTIEWGTNGNNAGIIYELYDVISNKTVYSGKGTSVKLSGFMPGEMQQYKARSKNDRGNYSNYTSVTTVYTNVNQPLSKGYDNISSNNVRLLWNPNGNSTSTTYHYEVRRKSDNALINQGTVNGTSATVTGLTGGHEKYRYFVRAKSGNGTYTDFVELQIPSLEVYQKSNYAKAEWAVEMNNSDVLIQTSFEDGEAYKPSFDTRFPVFEEEGISYVEASDTRYLQSNTRAVGWISKNDFDSGNYTKPNSYKQGEKYSTYYKMSNGAYRLEHNKFTNGVQGFTDEESYTSKKSYKIGKTVDRMGNAYWFPSKYVGYSLGTFPHTKAISNGTDLSLTFRAKTDNKSTIRPEMYGGMASWTYPLHEIYGLQEPIKVTQKANAGTNKVYVSGIEQLNPNYSYYVTNRQSRTSYINHFYYRVLEINKNEGYIILNGALTDTWDVGYVLHTHVNREPVIFGNRTIYAKDGWQLFNINAKVKDYKDYKSDLLGLGLWFYVTSDGNTYIDDVKLGYATKAQLYRDGTKIYEGFLSDYDDYAAIDKVKPEKVDFIKVGNAGNKINITFDKPMDYGTTYNYQVKALKHNGDTIGSEIKPVTITSGIKGYSYVIDSNSNTIPDNLVDTTVANIKKTINPNEKNYIHIKVIDNEGNVSDTFHQEINIPVLTATPNNAEDYIHLDWTMNDTSKNYSYMAYKKAEGESEYQTIPIKDRIKVLEVYPYVSVLKDWTDAYGMGKITTHSVSSEDFNQNPSQVWDYDVVVLGFADSNNGKSLSDNARVEIEKFVEQGKGLLLGHDTVYPDAKRNNYVSLATKYLNMESHTSGNWYNGVGGRHDSGTGGNSNILITKKGFLTNYPYKIGEVGDALTIPYDHTSYQYAKGDIWMRFDNENQNDPYNFYLTTWNNVAMAQTGHSIREDNDTAEWATSDEQKLIINTLFYLAQISDKTSFDDHTGQDITSPTKPIITDTKMINNGNTIHVKYTASEDKGTKYYYYVEGTAPNTKVQSNIADATIKSGLKGYSIVVDQNPNTIPDNIIETASTEYNINKKFYQKFYVHVAAVDNVGNISEVSHYECVDVIPPTLVVTGNATKWTNKDVILTATASDNESGLKGIKLPDGTWVYSNTATFVAKENGNYVFTAEDNFGNQTSVTVTVNKIDKMPPFDTSIIINNNDLYTNNRNTVLTISAKDNATGVSQMRFRTENSPWSAWIPYGITFNYTMDAGFTHQGTNKVYAQFKDGVRNIGGDTFDSIVFDNIAPTGEIIFNKNAANVRNINLNINAYDVNPSSADVISGLNSVRFRELQNGVVKQNWTSWEQHNFTRNWILSDGDGVKVIEMEIKDNAGNIGKVNKSIVLDTLFIKDALFTDIVNPPLGNPELPTSEVVKVKKGYEFTFIVKTTGDPDYATYAFNGESGRMAKLTSNLFTQTLKVDINDETVNNEVLPINITVARNDGTKKSTTLRVHVEGSANDDYNINLTN